MTGHLTPERSNPILLWCKNSPNWILPTVCKQIKAIICFCRLFFLPVHSSCTTSHCKDVLYLASIVLVPSHKWQSRGQCHRTKRYGSRQKKNTQKNSPRVFRFHPKKKGEITQFYVILLLVRVRSGFASGHYLCFDATSIIGDQGRRFPDGPCPKVLGNGRGTSERGRGLENHLFKFVRKWALLGSELSWQFDRIRIIVVREAFLGWGWWGYLLQIGGLSNEQWAWLIMGII